MISIVDRIYYSIYLVFAFNFPAGKFSVEFPISGGCHFFFHFLDEITRKRRLEIYMSLESFVVLRSILTAL